MSSPSRSRCSGSNHREEETEVGGGTLVPAANFSVCYNFIASSWAFDTPLRLCQGVGYGLVKAHEVWRAKTCCVVPARRR